MTTRAAQAVASLLLVALATMAHVGSPDTFFAGDAGPYHVRVTVRLPGVIPGRAQVTVRVADATSSGAYRVTVRAGQWNLGLAGAPPAEAAAAVPGDPALYAAELWLMTATSYQLFVSVDGPSGTGQAVVPVMAIATAERSMTPWLGAVLGALALFLAVGLLTIVGCAVRESVLPPGVDPDAARRRRARIAMAAAAVATIAMLWGGRAWWTAEASAYGRSVLYRPFASTASVSGARDRATLTLSIRDPRWTGEVFPQTRYNALMPDHGKLMHLFLVRAPALDAFAHLHPIARTPQALDFDARLLSSLPGGRYRVYADIVHESGYAQTLVTDVELPAPSAAPSVPAVPGPPALPADPDDSSFTGAAIPENISAVARLPDDSNIVWRRGDAPLTAGAERDLAFSVRDASGALLPVEPYMGMAAHVAIASADGSVFAHLHPFGSISMAALQRFAGSTDAAAHAGHGMPMPGDVAIPYAFPKPGRYRLWVQIKRNGQIETGAFDVDVRP